MLKRESKHFSTADKSEFWMKDYWKNEVLVYFSLAVMAMLTI